MADALRPLSAQRRAEILADLRAHLEQRRREPAAGVAAILAELGRPEDIAGQAGLEVTVRPAAPREIWLLVTLVLAVLAWPVGLVTAAVSGRWRLRSLVYAGITPLLGWTVAASALITPLGGGSTAASGAATCLHLTPVNGGPVFPSCTGGLPTVVPWEQIHPFLHVLGTSGAITAGLVGGVGGPIVAAIYLFQSYRHPRARPWLPVTTWGAIGAGLLLARAWGG